MVNDYSISDCLSTMKLVGDPMTGLFDCCTNPFELIVDAYMLEIKKHARWIKLQVCVTDCTCGIGISMIFDTVFRYLSIFRCGIGYLLMPPFLPIIFYHCKIFFTIHT